ncbi:MAG TPA: hypothetical protein VFU20_08685 [Sphingomicrobium sp.]|nr:hypothetical protein [Sphingomicrobium sp.]
MRGAVPSRAIRADAAGDQVAEGPPAPEAAAEPQNTYCERLNDFATPAECAYFDTIWQKLATGTAGVRFPSDLTRGESGVVSLVIALGGSGAGPSAEDLLGQRPDDEFKLKVARRMAAQLQGVGFEIDPGGLQHRDFHMGQGVRWDWRVTAVKARRHALTLSTYVVVRGPDGTQSETLLRSVERDLPVRVTLTQRFSDMVDWVVGISTLTKTLFGALGVILVALIAFRQRLGELKAAFVGK